MPLDEDIDAGQPGHLTDHELIHQTLNDLSTTYVAQAATDASGFGFVVDEDDLTSDSDTKVPTQQSVKAYVDATGGEVNDTAAEILTKLLTVDGTGTGLDADLLDGVEAAALLPKVAGGASVENIGAVESNVNTVAASGSTETLDTSVYGVHDVTMDQSCTFTFSNPAPSGKATIFTLVLRGAFTPTWPASVDWPDATEPTYGSPTIYTFMTVDGGTTWLGMSGGGSLG